MANVVKVGVVDDHEAVRVGFAAAASLNADSSPLPVRVVRVADTVESLLAGGERIFDAVTLDLSLSDGSTPADNVAKLVAAGYPVLVFSVGDNPARIREALAAGASGVSRKSDDMRDTLEAVRTIAAGQTLDNQDLAAAIDGDRKFVSAHLSDRERETLALYAAGFTGKQIATRMGISINSISTNIKRIREKYERVGRYSPTKLELHRRAIEDGVIPR